MAREVTVRLSADITGYVQSLEQAAQATDRAATSADNLEQAASRASQSTQQSSQGIQQAGSAASDASGSLEGLSGGMESAGSSAEVLSSNLDRSGTASQSFSDSLSTVGAQSQDAAGDMMSVGDSATTVSSNLDQSGSQVHDFEAALSTVGAQSQEAAGAMLSVGESATTVSSNLDGSGSQINNFESALSSVGAQSQAAATDMLSVSAGAEGASQSAGSARDAFSEFGSEMSRINSESRAFAGGLAVVGGGLAAVMTSVISTGIAYNTLQQVAGRAMETMTGSATAAADQMDRLHEFADTSPFARDVWITAQQQLMAFGMEAENVVPTMEGIQNAVAAIGGGDQEIMQLVDILGQVQGQGRITGRELQRMGQMGINAADIIGEAMGVSGNEIREQITAGALDADTAIAALTEGMNTRFAGAAEGLRDTMTGALDRIRARVRDLGGIIAAPLVDPNGGGFLVEAINQAADFGTALLQLNPLVLQIGGLGLTAAAGILAMGGAWGLASGQIMAFLGGARQALVATRNLTTSLFTTIGGLRTLAIGIGIAAAAWGAWTIIQRIGGDVDDFVGSIGDMQQALVRLSQGQQNATASLVDFERGWSLFGESVEGLGGAMERLTDPSLNDRLRGMGANFLGLANDVTVSEEAVERFDEAITGAFEAGNYGQAAAGLREVAAMADELGWSAEELADSYPQITNALEESASASGVAIDAQALLAEGVNAAALEALAAGESWSVISYYLGQGADATYEATEAMAAARGEAVGFSEALSLQADAAREAADGISGLVDDMSEYAGMALDAEATTDQWVASLQELDAAISGEAEALAELERAYADGEITQSEYRQGVEDVTFTLDRNTESGRENRAMLRDLAGDTWDVAAAVAAQEGSLEDVNGVIDDNIQALREAGEAANLSEGEIDDMIRTYMGFNEVEPIEIQAENRAQEIFDEVENGLNSLPDDFEIWLDAQDEAAQETIAALLEGDYEAVADITGDDALAQAVIEAFEAGDYRAVAELIAEDEAAVAAVYNFETGEYQAQVDILGNPSEANEIIAAVMNGDYDAIVNIIGEDVDASAVIEAVETGDYRALVDILGDPLLAQEVIDNFMHTPRSTDVDILAETAPAEAALDEVTRDRIATVMAEADSWNAEGVLTETARQRIANILAESNTGVAESDLNGTARQRIADILAEPNTFNAEGQLTNTARQRISDILAEALTWGAEGDLNNTSRDRSSTVNANANTWLAEMQLNRLARNRRATISVSAVGTGIGRVLGTALGGGAHGGRAGTSDMRPAGFTVGAYASGGRLPYTGLGTDQILGVSSLTGQPTAYVDDREWIINRKSSDRYDDVLRAINDDNPRAIKSAIAGLQGFASGGVPGGSMRPRQYPVADRAGAAIDYDRLANAIGGGGRTIQLNQTNHNPVRETDIEAALRGIDNLSIWDTSGTGGDR